jgi:hypothetical protein
MENVLLVDEYGDFVGGTRLLVKCPCPCQCEVRIDTPSPYRLCYLCVRGIQKKERRHRNVRSRLYHTKEKLSSVRAK